MWITDCLTVPLGSGAEGRQQAEGGDIWKERTTAMGNIDDSSDHGSHSLVAFLSSHFSCKGLNMGISAAISVPRLVLTLLGFVPIASLCMALFQFVSLHSTLMLLILPSLIIASMVAMRYPMLGLEALLGLTAGMVATGLYDLVRLGFIVGGMWRDFIPLIGRMALDTPDASPLWGYLWRYIGNGGAMGMTFMMLHWRGAGTGMLYGTAICCCLFGTLLWVLDAQVLLFRLTPLSVLGALTGHLVYGAVLGGLTHLMDSPSVFPRRLAQVLRKRQCRTAEMTVTFCISRERSSVILGDRMGFSLAVQNEYGA